MVSLKPARLGLVALVVGLYTTSARGDELDKVLANNAKSILAQIEAKKYKSIGVLKFEVQTGTANSPISLDVGRMNESLATRLENALILAVDEQNPIGIVRGASKTAAEKNKSATFLTKDGRTGLFMEGYPIAWGKTTVNPDVFLVGRLRFEPDLRTAVMTMNSFDQKDPTKLQEIHLACGQSINVTRQMLSDINEPFTVPGKVFKKRGGDAELADPFEQIADRAAVPIRAKAKPTETTQPPKVTDPKVEPVTDPKVAAGWDELVSLFVFRAYYDENEIPRTPDGNYPPPKPGQVVKFSVKSTERIGLVLLINGINTADYDRGSREVNRYTKWVLEPGEEYWIRGYYDGKKVYPFEVALDRAAAEARLIELAPRDYLGQIELHIYRQIEEGVSTNLSGGLALREYSGTADTLPELKQKIQSSIFASAKPVQRSLIVPGTGQEQKLNTTEFQGALAAKLVLTYLPMPKARVGREPAISPGK